MQHGSVLTFALRSTDPEYAKVALPDFRITVRTQMPGLGLGLGLGLRLESGLGLP